MVCYTMAAPLDVLPPLVYSFAMQYVRLHDLLAGLATLILLVGILGLVFVDREVPQFLSTGFATALGWTFRGGVQLQNELRHRNKGANSD